MPARGGRCEPLWRVLVVWVASVYGWGSEGRPDWPLWPLVCGGACVRACVRARVSGAGAPFEHVFDDVGHEN
nr:MAG TPA: hypothetical protein [Caudoviricetes sp.]